MDHDGFHFTQKRLLENKLDLYQKAVQNVPGRDLSEDTHLRIKREVALPAVRRALTKLARGCYCRCDECGEEISRRRLQLIPAAVYCTKCQQEHDRYA